MKFSSPSKSLVVVKRTKFVRKSANSDECALCHLLYSCYMNHIFGIGTTDIIYNSQLLLFLQLAILTFKLKMSWKSELSFSDRLIATLRMYERKSLLRVLLLLK